MSGREIVLVVLLVASLMGCNEEDPYAPQGIQGRTDKAKKDGAGAPIRTKTTDAPTERRAEPVQAQSHTKSSRSEPVKRPAGASRRRSGAPSTLDQTDQRRGIVDALQGTDRPSPLELQTTLEPTNDRWIARWSIRNRSEEPIYVATQLPVMSEGRIVPDPDRIYLRAGGDTLYMTKRLWRIPGDVYPLIQSLPFLIRLEPGQVHTGAIRVPPSLGEDYPYQRRAKRTSALTSKVVISFGYFTEAANPQPAKGNEGLFKVSYGALNAQRYVTSTPHPAKLVVH
ncbi:MAG: hypothetical protein JKY65_03190 [Planctomycetes bacterium]|nr:hypothetical protein [Planctomycetota bacterium]